MTRLSAGLLGPLMLLLAAGGSEAACFCECINGRLEPVCNSSMEIPPICSVGACQAKPQTTAAPKARSQAIDLSKCRRIQVFVQSSRQYEMRDICQ